MSVQKEEDSSFWNKISPSSKAATATMNGDSRNMFRNRSALALGLTAPADGMTICEPFETCDRIEGGSGWGGCDRSPTGTC